MEWQIHTGILKILSPLQVRVGTERETEQHAVGREQGGGSLK